ncbi:E3 ubiquitin ligase BIG BROTHER-related isoform X2 [Capsella rubella]|uniref:E3 ubiquitin ligase BIG BROTHER-related isoform X2 n=1 Tax=Capsella rubella TaxID=81985 RepID=UPI000CD598AD|nr:E3 ubiquitin ligase BIG BROTHER-related isoform X2 [Capsella rubella]
MSRFVNQSSVDENIAICLQYDLSEETISDDVIDRVVQQQYQNKLMCNDAALALKIQQEEEARVMSCLDDDEGLARTLQDLEGNLQSCLSDDEKLARYLQQEDESANDTDVCTHQYQPMQVNHSYIPQRDTPSTSTSFSQYEDGANFSVSPSNISHNAPANEDIDPANMTYEEINELEEAIGEVSKGLSQEKISRLKTHKYGTKTKTRCWLRKKKFVADDSQCSICLVDYENGDKIMVLPCNHIYHKDCISQWLKQNKVCCVCKAEVYP